MSDLVVCVSPNTSTDRIAVLRGFEPGGTFRTTRSFDQAGGSGTHAAQIVHDHGGQARSVVLVGGPNGERWKLAADAAGLAYDAVGMAKENRSSYVLIDEQQGKVAEVIDPGPSVNAAEIDSFVDHVRGSIADAGLVVLSGSLPPGFADTLYRDLIDIARRSLVPVIVDARGEVLRQSLYARPWLIKPNLDEFHDLVRREDTDLSERSRLLEGLVGDAAENILLSMSEEGAILATPGGIWRLHVPDVPVTLPDSSAINPVGSGDAMVGGTAVEWLRTGDLLRAATWGLAASWANLGHYEVPAAPIDEVRGLIDHIAIEQLA